MSYYCISCKVSYEAKVIKSLEATFKFIFEDNYDFKFIFPKKEVREKRAKVWNTIQKPLIPGYIFLSTDLEIASFKRFFISDTNCYGLIKNIRDNSYKLYGTDEDYASWVFNYNGIIKPSRIQLEIGVSVKVLSGPLANYSGEIEKVDKRNNKVCINFNSIGDAKRIWVPVHILSNEELKEDDRVLKEFSKKNQSLIN